MKNIYTVITWVSFVILIVAAILDPFAIPFQDWNDIPEKQKQIYIQKSEIYTYLKYLGMSGLLMSMIGRIFYVLKVNKQINKTLLVYSGIVILFVVSIAIATIIFLMPTNVRDNHSPTEQTSLIYKSWHKSPNTSQQMSVVYPLVDWSVVQNLIPVMSTKRAEKLLHNLQSYHHPENAIVFTKHNGQEYEVALKFSKDRKIIEDISYKPIQNENPTF